MRATVEPLIPMIVGGIHQAFSIAVSTTFQIGVVTTILASLAALAVKEIPLRRTAGAEAQATTGPEVVPTREGGGPHPASPRLSGSPSTD
jgi:hypothetical protein